MTEPGRPVSLGESEDIVDATALHAVLVACKAMRSRRNAGTSHVAREALWSFWERPRLPGPLVQSKYPRPYPWSPAARALLTTHGARPSGGWGLILEHLTPRNVLTRDLIEHVDEIGVPQLIEVLSTRLVAAVVTREEDKALANAGVGIAAPVGADPADVWARYRAAGFDPELFAPATQDL